MLQHLPVRYRRSLLVLVASLAAALVPAGDAAAEPWYSEPFNAGETDVYDGWGWAASSGGHAGPGLFTRMREDSHYGASSHLDLADLGLHEAEEVYWRYWLRLDPDFFIESPNRGKLPGPAGLYSNNCRGNRPSTTSAPCWSARTMFSRPDYGDWDHPDYVDQPHDQTRLGSYVYHVDSPSNRGDILNWDDDGLVDHGTWHCVEGRVRMNTPGQHDGVLQNWVDGDKAFDRRDFQFRRTGESQLHVRSMWMNVYHGGDVSGADNDVWLDSLVLSSQRVGCGDDDGYRFTDHADSIHRSDIDWLAARQVTKGCNPPGNSHYCPGEPVTRGQMATFIVRAMDLPPSGRDRFRDDDTSVHEDAIQSLAAAGITRGCNPPSNDRFCPNAVVTRAEMAAFVRRAWGLPDGSSDFVDIADSPFRKDIGAIAAADVTRGCNPPENDRYCPEQPVTRAQMATFLRRVSVRPPA